MSGHFRRVLEVQLALTFAEAFGWGFVYLHARDAGHSEEALVAFFALMFAFAVLSTPLISRSVEVGRAMVAGLFVHVACFAALAFAWWSGSLVLAAALYGLFIMLFWVPYNVVFLRTTTDEDRATRSTILFAIFAVASAVVPLVGGLVLDRWGFAYVAAIASASLVLGAVLVGRTRWEGAMGFDLARAFRNGRPIVHLVGLEGLWQGILWIVMPIGTLRLIDQASQYGAFLAFLGIMSGVASIAAGRWSDRVKDRRPPLVVSSVGMAVCMLVVPLTQGDVDGWSLAMGFTYFFSYMLMAFTFTLAAELGPGIDDSMGLREVMFNAGRVGGAGLVGASLLLDIDLLWPMVLASLVLLAMMAGYLRAMRRLDEMVVTEAPPVPTTP